MAELRQDSTLAANHNGSGPAFASPRSRCLRYLGVYAAKKAARSISMSWPRMRNEAGGAESVSPIAAEPLVTNKSGGER